MAYLIILRHGDCYTGPLNERGVEQIRKVALELDKAKLNPDFFVISPTERTRETADIIKEHFNNAAASREYDLFFEESEHMYEIRTVLLGLKSSNKVVLLSGHAETVNSCTYHMLDDEESVKLLRMIEAEKLQEYIDGKADFIITTAAPGEALILHADDKENTNFDHLDWKLYGYISEGALKLASDIKEDLKIPGKKTNPEKHFPVLVFER